MILYEDKVRRFALINISTNYLVVPIRKLASFHRDDVSRPRRAMLLAW